MEFVLSSIVFFPLQLAMLGRITTFARHGLHTTPLAGRTLPTKPTLRLETGAKDLWRCLATSRLYNLLREASVDAQLRLLSRASGRELVEGAKDAATKQEFLELAAACDEVADNIDDCRASG